MSACAPAARGGVFLQRGGSSEKSTFSCQRRESVVCFFSRFAGDRLAVQAATSGPGAAEGIVTAHPSEHCHARGKAGILEPGRGLASAIVAAVWTPAVRALFAGVTKVAAVKPARKRAFLTGAGESQEIG